MNIKKQVFRHQVIAEYVSLRYYSPFASFGKKTDLCETFDLLDALTNTEDESNLVIAMSIMANYKYK
jgi:hypothetical protein